MKSRVDFFGKLSFLFVVWFSILFCFLLLLIKFLNYKVDYSDFLSATMVVFCLMVFSDIYFKIQKEVK